MRLTNQLEKDVGCKVLQFINTMKIKKLLGYKTQRYTNAIASSEKDELGHMSPVTISCEKPLHQVSHTLIFYDGP